MTTTNWWTCEDCGKTAPQPEGYNPEQFGFGLYREPDAPPWSTRILCDQCGTLSESPRVAQSYKSAGNRRSPGI